MAGVPAGRLSIEIVAEIARLQQDLDKAKRAVNAASKDMAQSVTAVNDNFGRMAKMSGNAAFAARNLGFQVQDVITQLSLGQAPMKVFAAQGFQIADALGQLKREANASGQSVSSMLIGSMGKLGPLLLAAAAAAIAVGGALKVVQDDLNETGKVTLSYGDVALGTFDAIRAFTVDKLGPAFEWLASIAGTVWGYIADAAKKAANLVISVWVAVPNVLYAAFTTLPAAIAELFVNMANGAIKAIEDLVNKAINGLNSFSGMVNSLLGTSIGGVGNVSFGRVENNFKGAGSRAGAAMGKALTESFGDHVGAIESYIRPFAEARARMGDAAVKAGKAAGAKGGRAGGKAMAEEWVDPFADTWKASTAAIVEILKDMDKTIEEIAKNGAAELDDILKKIGRAGNDDLEEKNRLLAETYERVDALIGALGNMRGLGGLFGDIGSILTSKNPIATMLGMGGVGTIAGSLLGGQEITDKMGTAFTKSIKTTFPGLNDELAGKIGSTMAGIFQGSAIGGAVGGVMGGGKNAQLGSQVGGIAGQAIGSSIAALGKFGGPIGAIAGAILGNVLGSVMQATKRGGATIGASGVTGTWGNSSSRIDAATGMGGGAVDALKQLASALGVPLGTFSSSVSVRKNDLRFDPTGSGISKTSKGAISFGQDEEALLKAVIKDAIADGAFEGLSEGFKNYLTSGDVESRLQDVLNLKAVMNEAAQMRDPQGFALAELDKWRTSMLAIATATGEGMADIEYVFGERRKEILEAANDDTLQLERDRKGLLIQIAEMEGRSTEALAMARQMELDAAAESLRPLMQRIYQLQDEAVAAAKAAELAAEAKRIADERYGLETQLLQLLGDTNALRDRERATVSEANRDIFDRIEAIKAEQAAAQEAARLSLERADRIRSLAQEDFALQMRLAAAGGGDITKLQRENELRQASSDLVRQRLLEIYATEDLTAAQTAQAEAAKRIADERFGLETRLLQAQGDTAALRQRELDALDPANRALLQMIFNLEDAATAADAAAKAAEELATKQKAIADEIGGLNRQWLELTGQTAKIREMDLAALLSDEARAIQRQIWDYTDALEAQKAAQEAAAKAADEYTRRLEDARNALSAAYERESSALQGTINKFSDFAKTIREFREGLNGTTNPAFGYAQARSRFSNTATMAGFGNEASLGAFTGDAQSFLDKSRGQASTLQDYLRDVAFVSRSAKSAEGGAMGIAGAAEKQLKALEELVEGYIDLNANVLTVNQAIDNLHKLEREQTIPVLTNVIGGGLVAVQEELTLTRDESRVATDKSQRALEASAIALSRVERLLARVIRDDSLIVSNDTALTVSGTVTVGNTSVNPVPVDTTP